MCEWIPLLKWPHHLQLHSHLQCCSLAHNVELDFWPRGLRGRAEWVTLPFCYCHRRRGRPHTPNVLRHFSLFPHILDSKTWIFETDPRERGNPGQNRGILSATLCDNPDELPRGLDAGTAALFLASVTCLCTDTRCMDAYRLSYWTVQNSIAKVT